MRQVLDPVRFQGQCPAQMAKAKNGAAVAVRGYDSVLSDVVALLEASRRTAARSVNAVMTSTYWLIGQRIVKGEQGGRRRAEYGAAIVDRLAEDLTGRFGRGFGRRNLFQMRSFYLRYPEIVQTASAQLPSKGRIKKMQTPSAQSTEGAAPRFPLPWSHYVRLLAIDQADARGRFMRRRRCAVWMERAPTRSTDRHSVLRARAHVHEQDRDAHEGRAIQDRRISFRLKREVKDPFILEFLGLKDEYSGERKL